MSDPTEAIRRQQLVEINAEPGSRAFLEAKHGKVWDTSELQDVFQALGFMAPYIIVRRKADGVRGSLMFQANPRFYFGFQPEYHLLGSPSTSSTPVKVVEGVEGPSRLNGL